MRTYWMDEDERQWRSERHLHAWPASLERCWYTCECPRPAHNQRIEPVRLGPPASVIVITVLCAWDDCEEPRRPTSKYCSRACSNKNARARHQRRKWAAGT